MQILVMVIIQHFDYMKSAQTTPFLLTQSSPESKSLLSCLPPTML